jgi:hypothetical protein
VMDLEKIGFVRLKKRLTKLKYRNGEEK